MGRKTNFNDALDYIYVGNNVNDKAYLIANNEQPTGGNQTDDEDAQHTDSEADEQQPDFSDDAASDGEGDDNNNYYNDGNFMIDNDDDDVGFGGLFGGIRGLSLNDGDDHDEAASPLATAAFAAAAASASVAATAARITARAAHRALAAKSASGAAIGAAVGAAADSNVTNVAVSLGAMLLNDTLLIDGNDTALSIFGEMVNRSGLLLNATAEVNATKVDAVDDNFAQLLRIVVTSVLLGLMILVTIIGNVFVIAAIILERNLQNVANYLVASLAVADLFVACLVMPLGAVYEISQGWILGPELCDIWTSCDVLCCTASILHLVAIAMDRYWAVTNIDYIHSRTSNRVFLMIFCVWTAAVIVSLAPQFGWKDPDYLQRIEQQKCMVSQNVGYQVFATFCTFYVPLTVILALYWKIYQTARRRIHRRRPRPVEPAAANNNQLGGDTATDSKFQRLRLRLGRFTRRRNTAGDDIGAGPGGGTALALVEGHSTNTMNTVEDTEFSSSNVDSKSRAGIEQAATTSTGQISTVSHLVALANQQHAAATKQNGNAIETQVDVTDPTKAGNEPTDVEATTTTTTTFATDIATVEENENNDIDVEPEKANGTAAEVLEDPQLQQQLEQVQQLQKTVKSTGGASTSNATTITSISALSPQTPTSPPIVQSGAGPMTAKTSILTSCNQSHPLSSSANVSGQVTPESRNRQQQIQHAAPQQQQQQQQLSSIANPMQKVNKRKETLEAKRERKAAKTLAIITGAFVVCWLPFFVMALTLPLCAACQISDTISSLFLWLGYFNSTLNPVIYTIFSPEFRQAFKRILFGGHRPVHYRSGKL